MPNMTELFDAARKLGEEHGKNAGEWFLTSEATEEVYAMVLKAIEEGDPVVMEELPRCDLSGEWADGMTPDRLYVAIDASRWQLDDEQLGADLCDTYTDAFNMAAADEVERICRYHLQP